MRYVLIGLVLLALVGCVRPDTCEGFIPGETVEHKSINEKFIVLEIHGLNQMYVRKHADGMTITLWCVEVKKAGR